MTYLAKIGELTLKGSNIKEFENRLISNTKIYLKDCDVKITMQAGRLYIDCNEEDCNKVEFTLTHLVGITGWAKTITCEKNIEAICEVVYQLAKKAKSNGVKSFKIDTRRQDKSFELTSYDICCKAATRIVEEDILKVDVHKPDIKIFIEVRERCFIFSEDKKGQKGLPVGSSGKGVLLISGGLDSPVAGYKMICRGMKIDCVYFHSYPYTSEEAQQKVETLTSIVSQYSLGTYLNIIPFTDVQMKIKEKAPPAWTTLVLRICMMKVANMIAERTHSNCIITGESLGQVASQTIYNLAVTEHFAKYMLFRPLISTDKEDIIKIAKEIGTYETSILPYEDCCVLFSPKHPILKATIEEAENIYKSLDIDKLIQESYEKRIVKFMDIKNQS